MPVDGLKSPVGPEALGRGIAEQSSYPLCWAVGVEHDPEGRAVQQIGNFAKMLNTIGQIAHNGVDARSARHLL